MTATVNIGDLLYRWHTCHGTGQYAPAERRTVWLELLRLAQEHGIDVEYKEFAFDQAPEAWQAQASMPHAKVVCRIS